MNYNEACCNCGKFAVKLYSNYLTDIAGNIIRRHGVWCKQCIEKVMRNSYSVKYDEDNLTYILKAISPTLTDSEKQN